MYLLRVVLKDLKINQLISKYSKCENLLRLVYFLGHIILSEGIEFDPKKMEAIKNWTKPFTPTDIQCLLGLAGSIEGFGFASISSPLTTLTPKEGYV